MKTVRFFIVIVLMAGIGVFNAGAQMKKKPVPTPVATVTFDYESAICEFTGTATLSTLGLNYQLKGSGNAGETGLTYTINGSLAPVGDGSYTGPVTVEIKKAILCIEKATGTATYINGELVVTLNLTSFTTPICPKL